jgi:hypothetical protein
VPNRGGATNTIAMRNINDAFGQFDGTGTNGTSSAQQNHHFGKCGSTGDDYSFATGFCASTSLYPHSFNGGQGRYLQWWIK